MKRIFAAVLRRSAWCVFALALLVRWGLLAVFAGSPHFGVQAGDMRFYHDWALQICGGALTDGHAFYGLPGYAYLLAAFYKVVGVFPGVVLGVQAIADAATATLVYLLAVELIPHRRGLAVVASLGWMLFIPAQAFSAVLMPTAWVVAGYWFCVRAAMQEKARAWWQWLGFGTLVGVLAMGVATILFAVPLLLARALTKRQWIGALLLVAGLFLGTAPAWLHNRLVAHEPVFLSAHGGINFWIGNAPGANGYPKIPAGLRAGQQELLVDSIALAQQEAGKPLTRAEVSRFWSAKAWAEIHAHPAAWGRLLALKVKNFWNAFSYDDVTIIPLLREEGVLWPGVGFGVVASFGLAGLLLARGSARWVVAAVLLHMVALLPVFITERYRLAAVPGLLVLGAFGVSRMLDWTGEKRWPLVGGGVALCIGAAVFVHLPAPREMLASMEPYNLAISELEADQLDRAEKHLAQVNALTPGQAPVLFAQGNLFLKRGQPERAKAFYKQSLDKDPRNPDAWANLGLIACGEQRWEVACRLFERALGLNPADEQTRGLLAMARAKMAK